jgi:NAD(P)-dependent dehydrogenase (short-subunit alcohol dehydrogenase family)
MRFRSCPSQESLAENSRFKWSSFQQAEHAAAKAAVASPTAELAPAVTVNALAPGLTRTSITQLMPAAEAARLIGGAFNPRMAFLSAI